MEALFKIVLMTVIVLALMGIVRERLPEFAAVITVAAAVMLVIAAIPMLNSLIGYADKIMASSDITYLVMPVIKVLIITTIVKAVSDMCIDSGEKTVGYLVELAGMAAAILSILPMVMSLMDNVGL